MSERAAVIDLGSNSIKLLVAEQATSRSIRVLFEKTLECRISGDFESRQLPPERIKAAMGAVAELTELAKSYEPNRITVTATSAVREAKNAAALKECIHAQTGLDLRILSGSEEATYIAAGLLTDPQWTPESEAFCLMDQGGGSLELIFGHGQDVCQAISLPLGAVRLLHQYQSGQGGEMSNEICNQIASDSRDILLNSRFDWEGVRKEKAAWAGTGGAFTMTRAILASEQGQTLEGFGPELAFDEIESLCQRIGKMEMEERFQISGLPRQRADIYPLALIPILEVMKLSGVMKVQHSFHNLRFGLVAELLPLSH
ncbi:MAG: hypothetical protein AAFY98_08525 [Verrucomicrobiota bacterium]